MKFEFIFLAGILLLSVTSANAQNQTDSIKVSISFGTVFTQNGKKLTMQQLLDITSINFEAYNEMKAAKSNGSAASVFGFAGGFLVGWPLGTAIAGGDPNWALAGIGAGLIVVAIPFSISANKHAVKSVELYNSGLSNTGIKPVDLQFVLRYYGAGLKLIF